MYYSSLLPKKMKTVKVFLIFVVAACSAQFDYSRHQHHRTTVRPDNEDIFNGDYSINPNSNLHFSFQQIRRDQPDQIEERVENLHKYLYQRPTTTTPPPHFPIRSQFPEQNWNHQQNAVQPTAAPVHHVHPSPITHNLPEAPRLADIDESAVISQITGRNHQWNANPVQHQNYVHQPTPVPQRINTEVPTSSWSNAPVQSHRGGQHLRGPSRGGQRYSGSDNVNVEPHYQRVVTTPRAPPPPAPTLTPWSGDNFGK